MCHLESIWGFVRTQRPLRKVKSWINSEGQGWQGWIDTLGVLVKWQIETCYYLCLNKGPLYFWSYAFYAESSETGLDWTVWLHQNTSLMRSANITNWWILFWRFSEPPGIFYSSSILRILDVSSSASLLTLWACTFPSCGLWHDGFVDLASFCCNAAKLL